MSLYTLSFALDLIAHAWGEILGRKWVFGRGGVLMYMKNALMVAVSDHWGDVNVPRRSMCRYQTIIQQY